MIKSAGKIVYDTDNIHNVTFVKNLLEYSHDYSRSVGKNSLWYLHVNNTTAANNTGYESRRVLTQAVNNDGMGGAKHTNVIIAILFRHRTEGSHEIVLHLRELSLLLPLKAN